MFSGDAMAAAGRCQRRVSDGHSARM